MSLLDIKIQDFGKPNKNGRTYDIKDIKDYILSKPALFNLKSADELPDTEENGAVYVVPAKGDIFDKNLSDRVKELMKILGESYRGYDLYMYICDIGWEKISDGWESLDAALEELYKG